jgi:hypothetical protein
MDDTISNNVVWREFEGRDCPAINIKNYSSIWDHPYPFAVYDAENPDCIHVTHQDFNTQWIVNNVSEKDMNFLWEMLFDRAYDECVDLGKLLFGNHVDINIDGRMGGWLVVDNWKVNPNKESYYYEPEDEWNEQEFFAWCQFEDFVKNYNKNFLTRFLSEIYIIDFVGPNEWREMNG